jgi:hypothetical protein
MPTSKITDLLKRVAELEQESFEEPDGEFWQLLKQMREERGLPPPDQRDYGYAARDAVNELFTFIREEGENYEREQTAHSP